MLYYDLINEKDGVDIWYELARIYQNNVNVAAFTTLLHVTSDITNTSAMGAFFVRKGQQRIINSPNNKNN